MSDVKRVILGLVTVACLLLGVTTSPASAAPPTADASATDDVPTAEPPVVVGRIWPSSPLMSPELDRATAPEACFQNSGDAGTNSCVGLRACFQNSSNVGDNSCVGETACMQQGAYDPANPGAQCPFDIPCATVGNNSCNGTSGVLPERPDDRQ
ncbi:MAG: hypothetical protein R2706_19570 [Acidimicrobiales bacterium]